MMGVYYALRCLTRPAYRITGVGLGRMCEYVRRWEASHSPLAPFLLDDFQNIVACPT